MVTENEEFEFRARAEREAKGGGKPPLGFVAKQMWGIMPQNPKNLLKNLPLVTGALGGASPILGGAMMGTGLGQLARGGINKLTGQPQQGLGQIGGELGGAALSDVFAIPALKKSIYGRLVGAIEKARGVPSSQDIPSIPMTAGQKSIGEFVNEAVDSVKSSGGKGAPSYWLQIKDQVDRIYRMGKDEALTTLDKGRLRWLSDQVQKGLNAAVPGREVPAQALARSQAIPRFIGKAWSAIPGQAKRGAAYGAGAGIAGMTAVEIIKKLMGG